MQCPNRGDAKFKGASLRWLEGDGGTLITLKIIVKNGVNSSKRNNLIRRAQLQSKEGPPKKVTGNPNQSLEGVKSNSPGLSTTSD